MQIIVLHCTFLFFIISLLVAAHVDSRTLQVPDSLQVVIILNGTMFKYLCHKWKQHDPLSIIGQSWPATLSHSLLGGIVIFICLALPALWFKPIGGADLKLGFSLGYIAGTINGIKIIFVASFLFIVVCFIMISMQRLKTIFFETKKQHIAEISHEFHQTLVHPLPYIPCMVIALLLIFVVS